MNDTRLASQLRRTNKRTLRIKRKNDPDKRAYARIERCRPCYYRFQEGYCYE